MFNVYELSFDKPPLETLSFKWKALACVCPQKTPFGGFKCPKGVCGTFGRSVNIDFWFLRIFVRLEALNKKLISGDAR